MDFVADQLHDGRQIHILTVIGKFTREYMAATLGARLRSENVAETVTKST